MTEVIPFPRVRRAAPGSDRVLTVGVETGLVALAGIPTGVVRIDPDLRVRYVPEWELTLREETADLWIASRCAGAPDRCVVLETIAGDLLEQDDRGHLWLNAEELDPGALIAIANPEDERSGPVRVGDAAALLLGARDPSMYRFSVHVTAPVLWVFEQPRTLAREPVLDGWMRAAHVLWREQVTA